ncbi:MAG: capsular biosynthesis protein, partial [Pseudomonadota bacterium]
RLRLALDGGGPPPWAEAAFRARLAARGEGIAQVRGVEVSLFLSMLPLHADQPRKLAGFALVAAAILEELEGAA